MKYLWTVGFSVALWIAAPACAFAQGSPDRKTVETTEKTKEAIETLKANLDHFFLHISVWGLPPNVRNLVLLTDPKAVRADAKGVDFRITKKQATAIIDHLAAIGRFERTDIPVPGIPAPGWYLYVGYQKSPKDRPHSYYWALGGLGTDMSEQETIKFLLKLMAEDKEPREVLETMIKDSAAKKK